MGLAASTPPSPQPINILVFFLVFSFLLFFIFNSLNIMLKDLFKGGEQFWSTYPLKGPSHVFLFFWQPRDFEKLQNMNLQEVGDECIMAKWYAIKQ